MFKNPLKYQQGGTAPTQEQQKLLAAFIEWLPKRVKEFQGMQPEAIAKALDGMSKTPEGQKQVQQLMEQFQQEMQQSEQQAFRNGGKIHDFICKHAKGGAIDCGCGGIKVQKGGDGLAKIRKAINNSIISHGLIGWYNKMKNSPYRVTTSPDLSGENKYIEQTTETFNGGPSNNGVRRKITSNGSAKDTTIFTGIGNFVSPFGNNSGTKLSPEQWNALNDLLDNERNNAIFNYIKKQQEGGSMKNFKELPDRIYNENGEFLGYSDDSKITQFIGNRKDDRTFTFVEPTPIARINNTVNQSRMLWNPEQLQEPYGPISTMTIMQDPEHPGYMMSLGNVARPSVREKRIIEVRKFGGRFKNPLHK